MKRLLLRILLLGVAFLIVTWIVPGVELSGSWLSAFWAAIVFIVLNLLVRPAVFVLKLIALPLTLITLGLMSLLISFAFNILIFWFMDRMGWGIGVKGTTALILGPLALGIVNAALNLLLPSRTAQERHS